MGDVSDDSARVHFSVEITNDGECIFEVDSTPLSGLLLLHGMTSGEGRQILSEMIRERMKEDPFGRVDTNGYCG